MEQKKQKKQLNMEKLFKEHAVHYQSEDINELDISTEELGRGNLEEIKKTIIDRRNNRQKYLFNELYQNDIRKTNVNEIFDLAFHEIDKQETVKQNIETKAGIAVALLGIMVNVMFQSNEMTKFICEIFSDNTMVIFRILLVIIEIGWLISGTLVGIFVVMTLLCRGYYTFALDDEMLKAAVDNKEISTISLLETSLHVANRNLPFEIGVVN